MGGLKFSELDGERVDSWSHPTRDGWIEIVEIMSSQRGARGPIPHGMGGLKFFP